MPADAGAPDPMQQLIEMAMQAVQTNDTNLAMQVCQTLVQLVEQQAQAQGQPAEAPAEEPVAEEGEPVYGKGGKLLRRISK